jgi:hypothetical protein
MRVQRYNPMTSVKDPSFYYRYPLAASQCSIGNTDCETKWNEGIFTVTMPNTQATHGIHNLYKTRRLSFLVPVLTPS